MKSVVILPFVAVVAEDDAFAADENKDSGETNRPEEKSHRHQVAEMEGGGVSRNWPDYSIKIILSRGVVKLFEGK